MLSRNDLIKQFEALTKQEIINHNQEIYSTNLALNNLRRDFETKFSEQSAEINNLKNIILYLREEKSRAYNDILILTKQLSNHINDTKAQLENHKEQIANLSDFQETQERVNCCHQDSVAFNRDCNTDIQREMATLSNSVKQNLEQHHVEVEQCIRKFKKDFIELPSEAERVRQELKAQIAEKEVTLSCFNEEIQKVKKDIFQHEKKIETILIRIERLINK